MSSSPLLVVKLDVDSSNSRQHRRAYLSPTELRSRKLVAGEWVRVSSGQSAIAIVQLWPSGSLNDGMLGLSELIRGIAQNSAAKISRFEPTTSRGLLRNISVNIREGPAGKRSTTWLHATVKEALVSARWIHSSFELNLHDQVTLAITSFEPKPDPKRDCLADGFKRIALHVNDIPDLYEVDWRTNINVSEAKIVGTIPPYINVFDSCTTPHEPLGGLDTQIQLITSLLDLPLRRPELFRQFNLRPPRGILLFGPPGTGKTALARATATSHPDCSCIVVNGPELSSAFHGETEEKLRSVFHEAKKRSPCIIILDELDALCPRRDGDGGEVAKRVVATLLTLMDGMAQSSDKLFVIAATNRPNSIDPALRRPGRFDREIEIGIPDASGRKQIIDILLSKIPHSLGTDDITSLAARTHGFVGADLTLLVTEAATKAISRPSPKVNPADILSTLPNIRPSTMREVFVETQTVRWSDIGGQEEVKQRLRESVEWPLKHRDAFIRLGIEPPKGIILYGPPGNSKTLIAKALATESGLNFLAVKGPELLNKYVGESERAIREVFRKARVASPSIIFFDEIDALGSIRSGDGVYGGVVTTLLNEMDGIEELFGVIVVAATNRPDRLDSALMRPGRLDRILYIGPPDLTTRMDIFRIRLAKMATEPGIDVHELALMTDGCSGAEIASICQDAALIAMNEDTNAPFVKETHFQLAAGAVRRRITPEMIHFFEEWRDQSGVKSA